MSQGDQKPVAAAVRGVVKLPTASFDDGLGTGQPDYLVDAIVSKEVNERVEVSGYGGFAGRSSPDDSDSTGGFRYGVGVAVPTRQSIRLTAELFGEKYFDETITADPSSIGRFGRPSSWDVKSPVKAFFGLDFVSRSGFFAGAGVGWATQLRRPRVSSVSRGTLAATTSKAASASAITPACASTCRRRHRPRRRRRRRIGRRRSRRGASPAPCRWARVRRSRLTRRTPTATRWPTSGAPRRARWRTPRIDRPSGQRRNRKALCRSRSRVDDGKGGTATDTITIQVVKPPVKEYKFEDVHFDFDRYSLRPEATRVLDEAVRALTDNPELKIEIEGHTCNIGTAEYNLALGERRATSVREYLASRGVGADRLRTVSYGEERPKYDNAREETRRMNRRAALVVRLTQ